METSIYRNIWHLSTRWDEDEGPIARWTWMPDSKKEPQHWERDFLSEASLSCIRSCSSCQLGSMKSGVCQPGLRITAVRRK